MKNELLTPVKYKGKTVTGCRETQIETRKARTEGCSEQ